MSQSTFHVIRAQWPRDREALRSVRETVFVHEQHVPVALEWDGLDAQCDHVLARDAADHAIGTGRLTPSHGIGRMAVLREWRDQGVGAAMLHALLQQARLWQWGDVTLHAQADAIGFYLRFGFVGEGSEFVEAGIRHRLMRLALAPPNDA